MQTYKHTHFGRSGRCSLPGHSTVGQVSEIIRPSRQPSHSSSSSAGSPAIPQATHHSQPPGPVIDRIVFGQTEPLSAGRR
jgi:hypothetical protein